MTRLRAAVEVAGRYSNSPVPLEALLSHLPTWQRVDRPLLPRRPPIKIILRLGPEVIKDLVAAYDTGASTQRLADQYGVARTSVGQVLRRQGIKLRPRGKHPSA